jgi:hypothetical protein
VLAAVPALAGSGSVDVADRPGPSAHPLDVAKQVASQREGFRQDNGGWTGEPPAKVRHVRFPAEHGVGALSIVNAGPARTSIAARSGHDRKTWTPAFPGQRWFGQASVRALEHSRPSRVSLDFIDASGIRLGAVHGQSYKDKRGKWTRTWRTVGIAPAKTSYVVMRVVFEAAPQGETHYIDSVSLTSAPGGSPDVVGPLRTVGNNVVDGHGRPLVLRGVNRAGMEGANGPGRAPTAPDISEAKRWGANVVRLPLGEQYWLSSSCAYDPGYASRVDGAVDLITSRGMVALLDLHYNTIQPCGVAGAQPMADAPNSLNFWSQVAARYRDNALVAFDLYNEPHHISDYVWRFGGAVTWKGHTFQAAGMQEMYDAVRATGANNLVFASGNTWGNKWPTTAPLIGTNIVYAAHVYTCPTVTPPACRNRAPYKSSQVLHNFVVPGHEVPVMVTEFGWPSPTDGRFPANVIAYSERNGWGWAQYTWGPTTWGRFILITLAGDLGYEPSPSGQPALGAFPGR